MHDLAERFDYEDFKFPDHLEMWSRVEFLRTKGDDKLGQFVDALKSCITAEGAAAPREYVLRVQKEKMQELWGLDFESFDAEWIRWAKKEYRGKK
jgi:hypothetical protein